MNSKPSDKRNKQDSTDGAKREAAQAAGTDAPVRQAWPFAPGSQLGQQVAKPFAPKPSYRFNQR